MAGYYPVHILVDTSIIRADTNKNTCKYEQKNVRIRRYYSATNTADIWTKMRKFKYSYVQKYGLFYMLIRA